jgi:hypothetical protein
MTTSDVMTGAGAMRVVAARDPGDDGASWTDILRAMAVRKRLEESNWSQLGRS